MTAKTTADFDQDAYDELDDFESDDLADVEDADDEYLTGMWGSFRAGSDRLQDTLVAHGMVQSFVNAFARDGAYLVNFDETTQTAGTDMNAKRVVITPAPIADPSISAEQAGKILTGLAVHEICHPRYGRNTSDAVRKVFPRNPVADRLSNLLDDIRIERRFVAEYPGYAGVFTPTLEYVGKAGTKNGLHVQRREGQVNIAIAATRYPDFTDWAKSGVDADRKWWTDWAERWSREDSPKQHVDAIREALAHIAAAKAAAPKPQPKPQAPAPQPQASEGPQAQGGSDDEGDDGASSVSEGESGPEAPQAPQTESNEGGMATDDEIADEPQSGSGAASGDEDADDEDDAPAMSDDELNDATRNDPDELYGDQDAACSGSSAVEQSAKDNGTSRGDIQSLKRDADKAVEDARNIEQDGHGGTVDVAKSLKGMTNGGLKLGPSAQASRYIRNAILRSRTGHTAVTQHQKRGRLDGHGLARVGYGDTRIFETRKAPSPGKYVVWVMVDCSSSMTDELPKAAQVAHAMATATHGTPSVRLAVWGWSNPFRPSMATAGVVKVWEQGRNADDIFRMAGLDLGWTPDASVLSWAARAIKREARRDETPVIIFISDGAGDRDMNERVAEARAMGVDVYSVSFGMSEADQLARFGKGNYVPFAGSIIKTAKPLADLFARITSRGLR